MMSMPADEYATDLTDAQWRLIKPLLPASTWHPGGPGRPRRDPRQIINGLLYLTKTAVLGLCYPRVLGRGKRCMTTFAAGAYKGSGRRYWIDSPSGNAAGRVGYRPRRPAVSIARPLSTRQ